MTLEERAKEADRTIKNNTAWTQTVAQIIVASYKLVLEDAAVAIGEPTATEIRAYIKQATP